MKPFYQISVDCRFRKCDHHRLGLANWAAGNKCVLDWRLYQELKDTLTRTTSLIPQEREEPQMLPVSLVGAERENPVVTRLHFLSPLKECVDPIPGLLDGADGGGGLLCHVRS
jgi:hypothetical protein